MLLANLECHLVQWLTQFLMHFLALKVLPVKGATAAPPAVHIPTATPAPAKTDNSDGVSVCLTTNNCSSC